MHILLIILVVLAVLFALLCISGVVISVSFRGGRLDWNICYCGIRLLPRPKKEVSREASGIKDKLKEKFTKKKKIPEKEERKSFFMDKLWKMLQGIAKKADMAGSAVYALPKPVGRMLRGISWYAIETDFLIGAEDAADCAILYGRVHSLLHLLLAQTGNVITVKQKRISVECDFTADTCRWDFACRFRIRVGAVLAFGIGLVWHYLIDSKKAGKQLSSKKL